MKVLILGGTAEARALASTLHAKGDDVISSLAGRVRDPRLPVGAVRVGGFGGPEALAAWLRAESIDAVIDATHPFAARISASAATAASDAAVPLLMLRRPGWPSRPGWQWVSTLEESTRCLGDRVFLTTGRQGLTAFADCPQWFLIRCVDPPDVRLPESNEVLLARGPYTVDGERELMRSRAVDTLVTKDSGGPLTVAKLDAAEELGVRVVVVRRPPTPDVPAVETIAEAAAWLDGVS